MLNLKTNDRIENQPVIVRQISKKINQNGKEYYSLQISYGIKNYDAKIWNSNIGVSEEIIPGSVVNIWGVVREFKGNLQIHIDKILHISNPSSDLLEKITPSCSLEEDKLAKRLAEIIGTIKNEYLNQLLNNIFSSPDIKEAFYKKAAGVEIHHAYTGGLAQHTIEVAETVIQLCKIYNYIDYDMAVAGALLHDIGKIVELSNFPENKYTTLGRLLGHINIGTQIIEKYTSQINKFPEDVKLELQHCILSHHGSLETGSPVLPMTLEALVIHNADKTSAELNGFYLAIQRDVKNDDWTDYNNTFKRYIKKS
ncbi:hypothetical protein Q428_04805 [Fervidicella metallireducens AeB]|uniref:HD domain-containing protein n=1 Tax=Fervidicella metallireducens AeB TaxID=1403537 RepID=A0A017RXA5_9CLOT|nr:HD domain-containing protein [Fervidicella metallireducens]EYE89019.1 hypothetical protein Q428_04805 [Fervidicella metallireducens AeB]